MFAFSRAQLAAAKEGVKSLEAAAVKSAESNARVYARIDAQFGPHLSSGGAAGSAAQIAAAAAAAAQAHASLAQDATAWTSEPDASMLPLHEVGDLAPESS